jgi:uncharacterized protein YybS (DUF2232 family)
VSHLRWLALGAEVVLAALMAVALFASGGFLPVLGVALSLLCPLPFVVLRLRHGILAEVVALLLVALALAGPLSPWQALAFILEFGLPAILLGEGLRRAVRSEFLVIAVAAVLSLAGMAVLVQAVHQWGHPVVAVERHVDGLLQDMEAFSARLGIPGEGGAPLQAPIPQLRVFLLMAFPSLFFVGSLLTAAGYVWLLQGCLRRWPAQLGGVAPAAFRWELPEPLVWAFIGSGALYLIGLPVLKTIGLNGLILLVGLYFLQGLCIAGFLFRRFQLPRFLVTLSVLLLVIQPFLTLVVAGLGLFDVWFAFRRLNLPRSPRQT